MEKPAKSRENPVWAILVVVPLCLILGQLPSTLARSQTLTGRPSLLHLGLSVIFACIQIMILHSVHPVVAAERIQGPSSPRGILREAGRIGAVFLIFLGAGLLAHGLNPAQSGPGPTEQAPPGAFAALLYLVLSAGFACTIGYQEELLYRSYILAVFNKKGRLAILASILFSSSLFGLGHLYQGMGSLAASFLAACLLCALVRKDWSLRSLALGHAVWNFFVLAGRL